MSNATPHTHEIRLAQYWGHDSGNWRVKYGDSKVVLWFSWNHWPKLFWERRIRRAAKKVVRKHDRGSVKDGARQKQRDQTREYARQLSRDLNEKVGADGWGSTSR